MNGGADARDREDAALASKSATLSATLRDRVLRVARAPEVLPWPADIGTGVRPVSPHVVREMIGEAATVDGQIGDASFRLQMSRSVLSLWLSRQEPLFEGHDLDPVRLATVLEFLLADLLTDLEDRSGRQIRLDRARFEGDEAISPNFAFAVTLQNIHTFIAGSFDPRTVLELAMWASRLPSRRETPLHVNAALRVGHATLDLGDLRDLRPGDGIVMDVLADESGALVIGERLIAPFHLDNQGAVLVAAPASPIDNLRHWMNSDISLTDFAAQPTEGNAGSIQIKVVFDVGRVDLFVSEIETIGEGHVFPLARSARHLVDIVAQGRIIGRGEIIEHEDLRAVRVTSLTT